MVGVTVTWVDQWGAGGVGQGPPLPAGHHSTHSRQGGDDGRGHAHRDEDRPEAGPRPRGWVPGADEVLVNTLRQGVGLPATGGLALEGVLPRHPEPAVTPVLHDAVQPVVRLSRRGEVTVLDPRHWRTELERGAAGERSHPLARVTGPARS